MDKILETGLQLLSKTDDNWLIFEKLDIIGWRCLVMNMKDNKKHLTGLYDKDRDYYLHNEEIVCKIINEIPKISLKDDIFLIYQSQNASLLFGNDFFVYPHFGKRPPLPHEENHIFWLEALKDYTFTQKKTLVEVGEKVNLSHHQKIIIESIKEIIPKKAVLRAPAPLEKRYIMRDNNVSVLINQKNEKIEVLAVYP